MNFAKRQRNQLLLQTSCCVIPSMTALFIGMPAIAGRWFFASLILFVGYNLLRRRPLFVSSLLISVIPLLMLLRGAYFFYNSIAALFGLAVIYWLLEYPKDISRLLQQKRILAPLLFSTLYWWGTYLATGSYAENLRIMDLVLAATAVYLLGSHRTWLRTALLGLGISIVAMGIGFMPYGDRLGAAEIDDQGLGNPISFGLPAALIFLLTLADGGTWVWLQRHRGVRLALNAVLSVLLILSTSRGSWVVVVVGLSLLFFLGQKSDKRLLVAAAALATVGFFSTLASGRGDVVQTMVDKTFSSDKSLAKRTTGRSNQWLAFPAVLQSTTGFGVGPGFGHGAAFTFTGRHLAWHSLYLHVGVELGIFGLLALSTLLVTLVRCGVDHWRRCREVVPLIGAVGFMMIGVSISGFDCISGVFLGLAYLGGEFSQFRVIRPAPVRAAEQQVLAAR